MAEARLFHVQVGAREREFLVQRRPFRVGAAQGVPKDLGELLDGFVRACRIGVDQRGDRIERIEKEMRIDLRAQRLQFGPAGLQPQFLRHLRNNLGLRSVKKVIMHEPLTNIRPVIFLQMERGTPTTEVWRALYGVSSYSSNCGKFCIALNEDIDPTNGDFLLWALAYRTNPRLDVQILDHRAPLHGPKVDRGEESTMLIDATLKGDMPPIALPKATER